MKLIKKVFKQYTKYKLRTQGAIKVPRTGGMKI